MKQKIYSMAIGLIEMMLVIALVAVMAIVSVRYYSGASASQKVSSAVNMFAEVKSAVENYALNNNNNITGLTLVQLVEGGYLPNAYALGSGSSAQATASLHSNPYYGTVTIAQSPTGLLTLTMTNVPSGDCANIVNQLESTLNQQLGESASSDCEDSTGSGGGTVTVNYVF